MDLPQDISLIEIPRARTVAPRVPLAAIVPAADVLALGLAVYLCDRFNGASFGTVSIIAYAAIALFLFMVTGQHRPAITQRVSADIPLILGSLAVTTVVVLLIPWSKDPTLVKVAPIAMALVIAFRALSYRAIRIARARGFVVERTLIVGAGVQATQLARTLLKHPEFGLQPVGFVDSVVEHDLPLPILGPMHDIKTIITDHGVRRLIIAFGITPEPQMIRTLRSLSTLAIEVHVIPRLFEFGGTSMGRHVDDLWGIPIVQLRRPALRSAAWRVKRAIDVAAASVLLILASPVLLACAIGVRMSSPGPTLFKQKRVGQHGELFELLKFRSMRENDNSDTNWSGTDQDLMTGFGRFMRRTGIDELPQLWNVLRGEMSLVGPRPERPHFADRFSIEVNGYEDRHRVPVGITGWAQVHGLRGDSSIAHRATFDNNYIEQWSLWHDVVILARTGRALFMGEGR